MTVVVGVLDGHPHGTVVVSTILKSGHACKFRKHSSGLTVDVTVGQEFAAVVALDAMKLVERVLGGGLTTSRGLRERERGRRLLRVC